MIKYENTPGKLGVPLANASSSSKIAFDKQRPTLIMLIHPQCPCTRASIAELTQLMSHEYGKLKAYAVFLAPSGVKADWHKPTSGKALAPSLASRP